MSPSASAPTPTTPFGASADLPKPPGLTWRVQSREPVGYDVHIVRGLLDPANPTLARACGADGQNPTRCLVVVDDKVRTLYGERVRAYLDAWRVESFWKVLPGDEAAKELTSAVEVTEAMTAMGLLRRTEKVVAIGGGVVLDVAGFAASLYRRGVPYVRVPTTLLGQIDAGIGVKTGVNHGTHKNRLGTYYAPETALIDPEFLATVDPRHIVNGTAEIIKMALVKDRTLFELLEAVVAGAGPQSLTAGGAAATEVISRAIAGMLDELEPNLWEQVLERSVDYGHTFSPSLELRADPPLLHGEAVAADMAICVALAHHRGLLCADDTDRALRLMHDAGLPLSHPVFTTDLLAESLRDAVKHRDGLQRVPLTDGIGRVRFVNDLTHEELGRAREFVAQRAAALGAPEDGRVLAVAS
ncbi:sedoheptulose 7-phosphate cyclase [Streptomyces griseofuscus]|uniref:2-epi-5-epi-valiolone synthase n=1 Tax=Streptomyces griseofuscus TaxID=146922 RepID=A0A3R8S6Y9_9ACTN|nr:sedoheptulose 7-phosphate cyclase [Streptomyces griseofuscus]RRQ78555.1 2-epi-5-epi-valiolone synthase [Streptomyces griseofuscus]